MKEIFNSIFEFFNVPIVQAIISIVLVIFSVPIIIHACKVIKKPAPDFYDKETLQCIAFGLSCAIDEYQEHYPNEDLLCNEHYVKICILHRDICKMLGEDTEGRKLKCLK